MRKILIIVATFFYCTVNSQENATNLQKKTAPNGETTFVAPPPIIEFVGDANIQKSLNNGSGIPANTGIGVVYREILPPKYNKFFLFSLELGLTINVASTADTLKTMYDASQKLLNSSDFGNSILLPSNSGQAYNLYTKFYFTNDRTGKQENPSPIFYILSGGYINLNGSNRNWNDIESKQNIKASTLSFQAGLFHEFIAPSARENYSITLGAGYTSRRILGDIVSVSNEDLRKRILGTTKTFYNGYEVIIGLRLKNIKAEVRIPVLSNKESIPGLTGTQPNTFIGFTGGFPLKLN